jgi:hypothetical protein
MSSSKGSAAEPAGAGICPPPTACAIRRKWGKRCVQRTAWRTRVYPPWRGAADSSQLDLARVAQKTVASRATIQSSRVAWTSFANRSVRRSPKRPHHPPRQRQGNDDAIFVRAQAIMSVEQPGEVSATRPPVASGSGLSTRCSRKVC